MALTLLSSAFDDGAPIPRRYTSEGEDISPPLFWSGAPQKTRSFVLIVEDPDAPDPSAPQRTWVHWVVYNIPAHASGLPEHVTKYTLVAGAREGINDWGRRGWGGPCPPVGRHRYFFRLYALDAVLPELATGSKSDIERMFAGHVLATASLMGTYETRRYRPITSSLSR